MLLNDGNANFGVTRIDTVGSLVDVALADIDNDGDIDAAAAQEPASLVIFLNDGTGRLDGPLVIGATGAFPAIDRGDFDLDGDVDFALANQTFSRVELFSQIGFGAIAGHLFHDADGNGQQGPETSVYGDQSGEGDFADIEIILDTNQNGVFDPISIVKSVECPAILGRESRRLIYFAPLGLGTMLASCTQGRAGRTRLTLG